LHQVVTVGDVGIDERCDRVGLVNRPLMAAGTWASGRNRSMVSCRLHGRLHGRLTVGSGSMTVAVVSHAV